MTDDGKPEDGGPDATDEATDSDCDVKTPRFQFGIGAIMAVTATVGVVLASVGKERVPELLFAACFFTLAVWIDLWLVRRFRQFAAAWRAPDIQHRFGWMLLGAVGAYIVLVSTDAYDEPRHRIVWSFACGMAAMFGASGAHGSTPKRALVGSAVGAATVGPGFLIGVLRQRADSSLTVGIWETVSAALAGATVVLAVDTLHRLEDHWQLPRYAMPCIWLIAASAFAEIGSHFVVGW